MIDHGQLNVIVNKYITSSGSFSTYSDEVDCMNCETIQSLHNSKDVILKYILFLHDGKYIYF